MTTVEIYKKEEIKNIIAIKPIKAISPIDKASQSIFHPQKASFFYRGGVDLDVGRKGNKEVTVGVTLEIV